MSIISFNRRLVWVILPAVCWALAAVAFAQGMLDQPRHPHGPPPVQFGMQRGGLRVVGRLQELVEEPGRLSLVLAVPPGQEHRIESRDGRLLDELPEGIELRYVDTPLEPGRHPHLRTLGGPPRPMRLPEGGFAVLTEDYLIRVMGDAVTLQPRPMEFAEPWGPRKLKRRMEGGDEVGAPGPGRGRPKDGPPELRKDKERGKDQPPPRRPDGKRRPGQGKDGRPPDGEAKEKDGAKEPGRGRQPPGPRDGQSGERPPGPRGI